MKSRANLTIERSREAVRDTESSIGKASLNPGDRVVVLDVFGKPTGIYCTVQEAERHSVAVTWKGGGGIKVGRSWLRKVS